MENQNAVQVRHDNSLPLANIEDMKSQIQAIEACIKTMMVDKRHYGTVPGCGDKKALFKSGAEMLAKLFQIRPEYKREMRDLGNGHREIVTSCIMISRVSGVAVGEGSGTCSTMESKYRWRKAKRECPNCGAEIYRSKFPPQNDKTAQPGWYCSACKAQFTYGDVDIRAQKTGRVENPDIADQYNTVQKIADKRAYVAAVITTTGASDYVTQDINDFDEAFPEEMTGEIYDAEVVDQKSNAETSATSAPAATATTAQTPIAVKREELIAEALKIIGTENEAVVTSWAVGTKKIQKGKTWRDLDAASLNTIVKSGKGFMAMVSNWIDGATA